MKAPIEYKGRVYPTKTKLARELGVSASVLSGRIKAGWPQEKWGAPLGANLRQIEHMGRIYPSRVSLAIELGVPVDTLVQRIKAGWPEEEWGLPKGASVRPRGAAISYGGEVFQGLKALGNHLGISEKVLSHRINRGWPEKYWAKPLGFRTPSDAKRSLEEQRRVARERNLGALKKNFPNKEKAAAALLAFMEKHGFEKVPTAKEMRSLPNGSFLVKGIQLNGGVAQVSEAAGLQLAVNRKHQSEAGMREWSYFKEKLFEWVGLHGTPGVMPTSSQLKKVGGYGQTLLAIAGSEFGGMKAVAEKLGLEYTYQVSEKDWDDIEVVKAEVLAWNRRHRRPLNILPTASDLGGSKEDRALSRGIRRHGYFPDVAEALGLEFHGRKRRCGVKTLRSIKAPYLFSDLPPEAQKAATGLATSLGISPAKAWAQIVERLPVEEPLPKPAAPSIELADPPMPLEEARQWLWEALGIPLSYTSEEVMGALVQGMEEEGLTPMQIRARLGLLPSQLAQFKRVRLLAG